MDLVATVPGRVCFSTLFSHAGKTVLAQVTLDWLHIRPPPKEQDLWVVVAETEKISGDEEILKGLPNPLVLITNRPVRKAQDAQEIYQDWRLRPTIEHFYRFIQEDGLDVEKIQLQTLESFRREFVLILAAALFVLRLPDLWEPSIVRWLRKLGSGRAGTAMDREGPYLLLLGIQRVINALSVLASIAELLPNLNSRAGPNALLDKITYG